MAHKKGVGSSRNGRDSNAQRLGIKRFDGELVLAGTILVRQHGTCHKAGKNVGVGRDHTLYAKVSGIVDFQCRGRRGKFINIKMVTDISDVDHVVSCKKAYGREKLLRNLADRVDNDGMTRIRLFRKYPVGWYYGEGRPASLQSEYSLALFLSHSRKIRIHDPSIFLTKNGNFQLIWKDGMREVIEVECFPDKFGYCIVSIREEGEVSHAKIDGLINKIKSMQEDKPLKASMRDKPLKAKVLIYQ